MIENHDEIREKYRRGEINLEQYWAILVERGILSPNFDPVKERESLRKEKISSNIRAMMEDLRQLNVLPFPHWQNIKTHTTLWFKNCHPLNLNRACKICEQFNVPLPSLLSEEISKLGTQYISGEISSRPSDTKPLKKLANDEVMVFVANLIHIGATLNEAAAKAATWYSNEHPELPLKTASGIERDYSETWRASGYEKECFEQFGRTDRSNPEWRKDWEEIRRTTPEAEGNLRGNRRSE